MIKIEIDYETMTVHIFDYCDYNDNIIYRKLDLNIYDLGYNHGVGCNHGCSILKLVSDKLDKI